MGFMDEEVTKPTKLLYSFSSIANITIAGMPELLGELNAMEKIYNLYNTVSMIQTNCWKYSESSLAK